MKYYIFTVTYEGGSGEYNILAADESAARVRLSWIMVKRHPDSAYTATLKRVMPA